MTSLHVSVPVRPRVEFNARGKRCMLRRWRYCQVPLGTHPLDAVALCKRGGIILEECSGRPDPEPPLVLPGSADTPMGAPRPIDVLLAESERVGWPRSYRTDLDIDRDLLDTWAAELGARPQFAWMLRELGTELFLPLDGPQSRWTWDGRPL